MNRTLICGLAAAAALTCVATAPASAGVRFYFGAPGYQYAPYYPRPYYYQPQYRPAYVCRWVVVGYKRVWNGYYYITVPRKRQVCN